MKNNLLKTTIVGFAILVAMLIGTSSCNIEQPEDPNAPSVDAIESDATISELNNVVTGMIGGMRDQVNIYLDDCGVIGRDYYRFTSADPRFTSDLPGTGDAILDNNTFYIVNPWSAFYRVIRNGWVLRHAIDNTTAPLTQEQKNGYLGIAKTLQALMFIQVSNLTYSNGIRVDVEDPDNYGPIVDYNTALDFIATLLDDGYSDLQNGGDAFVADLSGGFAGFNTPQTFAQFNRALRARVAVYQQDWGGAIDFLGESFYSLNGDLKAGCYIPYSTGSGEFANQVFISIPNQATNARVALNFWAEDAETGDLRLSKVVQRSETAVSGNLSSDYDVAVWSSQDDDICIIRNEELVLIAAEAQIQNGDLAGGENALNVIRNANGLDALTPGMTQSQLTDEMLKQRRYSLFAEGHRWVDMRRYNRLDQIEKQNADEDIWNAFPIPAAEPQ